VKALCALILLTPILGWGQIQGGTCFLLLALPVSAEQLPHYDAGKRSLSLGDMADANRELRLALSEQPDHPAILDALGQAEYAAGRYRSAKRYFERALKHAPDPDGASAANLAQACHAMGEYTRAEQLLRGAVQAQPRNAIFWHALGQALVGQQRYQEAREALEKALALENQPYIWSDLANVLLVQRKQPEALDLFQQALAATPSGQGRARIRTNVGIVQWKLGHRAESETALREALHEIVTAVGTQHPDTARILENYSEVLRRSGRKKEAKKLATQAAEIRSAFSFQDSTNSWTIGWQDIR